MDMCIYPAWLLDALFVLEGLKEVRQENKFTLRSASQTGSPLLQDSMFLFFPSRLFEWKWTSPLAGVPAPNSASIEKHVWCVWPAQLLPCSYNVPVWRGKPLMYRFTCSVAVEKPQRGGKRLQRRKKRDSHGFHFCHRLHMSSLRHRAWWTNMKRSLCQIKVQTEDLIHALFMRGSGMLKETQLSSQFVFEDFVYLHN